MAIDVEGLATRAADAAVGGRPWPDDIPGAVSWRIAYDAALAAVSRELAADAWVFYVPGDETREPAVARVLDRAVEQGRKAARKALETVEGGGPAGGDGL